MYIFSLRVSQNQVQTYQDGTEEVRRPYHFSWAGSNTRLGDTVVEVIIVLVETKVNGAIPMRYAERDTNGNVRIAYSAAEMGDSHIMPIVLRLVVIHERERLPCLVLPAKGSTSERRVPHRYVCDI